MSVAPAWRRDPAAGAAGGALHGLRQAAYLSDGRDDGAAAINLGHLDRAEKPGGRGERGGEEEKVEKGKNACKERSGAERRGEHGSAKNLHGLRITSTHLS